MNRTVMLSDSQQSTDLGKLLIPSLGVETDYSSLCPYVSGSEDFEVLLKHPGVMREHQPIEVNGFSTHKVLSKALSMKERLEGSGIYSPNRPPYEAISSDHPLIISYPPEVIWLGKENGVDAWGENIKRVLPRMDYGFNERQIRAFSTLVQSLVLNNPKTYGFWRAASSERFEGEAVTKILLDWSIDNTIGARGKWIAGLTPVIDASTPGSATLSHRINEACKALVDTRLEAGEEAPAYLYTINLNSSVIEADRWTEALSEIVRNARIAMEVPGYEGIYVSIRGLDMISTNNGRVNTLMRLMEELNSIARSAKLPTWWSRLGCVGLAALDLGTSFSSFTVNCNNGDVFHGGGPTDRKYRFGRIFNHVTRERWDVTQVMSSRGGPDSGLPPLNEYWSMNYPTQEMLQRDRMYRVDFSKPYNIAAMNHLMDDWLNNIRQGEVTPGREFLQNIEAPYSSWGIR